MTSPSPEMINLELISLQRTRRKLDDAAWHCLVQSRKSGKIYGKTMVFYPGIFKKKVFNHKMSHHPVSRKISLLESWVAFAKLEGEDIGSKTIPKLGQAIFEHGDEVFSDKETILWGCITSIKWWISHLYSRGCCNTELACNVRCFSHTSDFWDLHPSIQAFI